ncbi:MAG: hypothetical protein QME58_02945 [Bacteroidota bacterium]|nr:hypothetical protein [Bacteroidota bacterium]
MILKIYILLLFVSILSFENLYGQAKKGGWLFTPAFIDVETPNGRRTGLGSGVSLESFLSFRSIAFGLSSQVTGSKFLDVSGGFFKLMPRAGIGYSNDDHVGVYIGGTYGIFIANNGGSDGYDPVKREFVSTYENHFSTGAGIWFHFLIGKEYSFDLSLESGGPFVVKRIALKLFGLLTLNFSNMVGPNICGNYFYPGIILSL